MRSTLPPPDLEYPETDGQPMANNTIQAQVMMTLKENLDAMFRHRDDVFIAIDLFWYPVKGRPDIRHAPDVIVVFGRPKGHRRSYEQWEAATRGTGTITARADGAARSGTGGGAASPAGRDMRASAICHLPYRGRRADRPPPHLSTAKRAKRTRNSRQGCVRVCSDQTAGVPGRGRRHTAPTHSL